MDGLLRTRVSRESRVNIFKAIFARLQLAEELGMMAMNPGIACQDIAPGQSQDYPKVFDQNKFVNLQS